MVVANGKDNLDKPVAIFRGLDIPMYAVWDCDEKNKEPTRIAKRITRCSVSLASRMGRSRTRAIALRRPMPVFVRTWKRPSRQRTVRSVTDVCSTN